MRCPQFLPDSCRLLAHPIIAASVPGPERGRDRLASVIRMADSPAYDCFNGLTPANRANVNNKHGSSSLRYLSCRYIYHHAESRCAYVYADPVTDIPVPSRWGIALDSGRYGQF